VSALIGHFLLQLFGTRRAPLVLLLLAALAWTSGVPDYLVGTPELPRANAADMALWAFNTVPFLVLGLGVGFLVLVGDFLPRSAARGTLALTAVRSSGRRRWWTAQMLAFGIAAVVVAVVAMLLCLLVGLLRLPEPFGPGMPAAAFLRLAGTGVVPAGAGRVAVLAGIVLLVAAVLWVLALVSAVVALRWPHPVVPVVVVLGWLLVELATGFPAAHDPPKWLLFDPFAHVRYGQYLGFASGGLLREGPHSPLIAAVLLVLEIALLVWWGARAARRRDLPSARS